MTIETTKSAGQSFDLRRVAMWALALVLPVETFRVLIPGIWDIGYSGAVVLMFFDLPLAVIAFAAVPEVIRRAREREAGLGLVTAGALVAMALLGWLFHPSLRGLHVIARLVAGLLLVAEITRLDRIELRYRLVGPLLISGSIQGMLALGQSLNGGSLGVGFGELGDLHTFGGTTAGSGTTLHPYVLAAFAALVATAAIAIGPPRRRRRMWLVGIALTSVSLGVTFARSAVAGLAFGLLALVVAVVRGERRYRAPVVALLAGALIPAIMFGGGWLDRVETSTTTDPESFSSGRVTHIEQAFDVIGESVVVGVGPGRYGEVLEARHDPFVNDAVHNVALLVAAEDGLYAGVVYLMLMLALAIRAWRTSPGAFALVTSLAGFMAFDKLTYLHPNGLLMFAIWLGVLDHLAASPGPDFEAASSDS